MCTDNDNTDRDDDEGEEGYRTGNWGASQDRKNKTESLNPYDADDPDHEGFNAGYRDYYNSGQHIRDSLKDRDDDN